MRSLLIAAAAAFCLSAVQAEAAPLANCESMYREMGKPRYRGSPPPAKELCRIGYVLSHNNETKVPDWVVEDLVPDRFVGDADRNELGNPFKSDPDLKADELPHATLRDYRGSKRDRGHMAPAGDMKWDEEAMKESFYLSNMAPQVGVGFNRGIWRELEAHVRKLAKSRGRLIVVTGPIYGGSKTIGPGKVAEPREFYKIIYDPERNRALAFVLPNKKNPGGDFDDFVVSIREVERKTGLDFLSKLSRRKQRILERRVGIMWRR